MESFDSDDVTTIADDGIQRAEEPADGALPPVERALGFILDERDEGKVAKHVIQMRRDQEPAMSRRRAVWKCNRWWREGRRWVRLEKKQDQSLWEAKLPLGTASMPPMPNKTDRLCRRLINTILVDKPYPECEPGDDSSEAREAAEFATRYLSVKGGPSELNMSRVLRASGDKAQTYASAFGWVTMNPVAGGHRPRKMLAHPMAQHKENAYQDPMTGLSAADEELTERYLRPDGYLSDDPADADLQWLPAPKIRLLTGLQLAFVPETARGLADAIGVIITDATTLGELRQLFPDGLAKLTKEQVAELCKWRPDVVEDILPPYTKEPKEQKDPTTEEYLDSQMVVVTTIYYESCAEYPFGCYAVIGGDTKVLHRQKWSAMMESAPAEDGTPKPPHEECLEIPISQCRCLDDDVFDDPYGIGIVQHLGPSDEIRASAFGFELEHMFRSANPIPMLPTGSIVQPKAFRVRDGTPIYVNPQGKPEWENVPPLSQTVPELRQEMTHEMDDESGLQQSAQGVEGPTVKSGVHAQTIVQEALKAVTNMKDNIGDYYIGLCRIILQQARAFCTVPQMLSYVGKDGEYKEREWSRTDFRTTRSVSIAKGSFTMHTLIAKQEMANNALAQKAIDIDEYRDIVSGGVSPVLGMQENPHLMRIRRQLDKWSDGPSREYQAAKQAQDAAQQQTAMIGGAPPAATPLPTPFSRKLPIDSEPMPAKIRHRQISAMLASSRFEAYPPDWQQVLLDEYAEMKNAAGIMSVPDVQRAKAAEAANAPPALPKGVSITMKANEQNVAAEERAALEGFAPTAPPSAAPASPSPSLHIHTGPTRVESPAG